MTANELFEILISDNPRALLNEKEAELFLLIPELKACKGFDQHNEWHPYDVYEHIMRVVEGVDKNIILRLAALFHDIGKPIVYTEDEKGIGHFKEHWTESEKIFLKFAKEQNIPDYITSVVAKLIKQHDHAIKYFSEEELNEFSKEELIMLIQIKKADLLAQNPKYHYLLADYDEQLKRLLTR